MTSVGAVAEEPERYVPEREVAAHLSIGASALRNLRLRGEGPRYYRLGDGPKPRIRYLLSEVEAWMQSHAVDPQGRERCW